MIQQELIQALKDLLAVSEIPTGPAWDRSAYRQAKEAIDKAEGKA